MKKNILLIFFFAFILSAAAQDTVTGKAEIVDLKNRLRKAEDSIKQILENFTVQMDSIDQMQESLMSTIDSVKKKVEKLDGKLVRFGVSIGYNVIYGDHLKNYQSAGIDVKDTTLRLETMDPNSIKVSTSIVIVPLTNADWLQEARENNRMKRLYVRSHNNEVFKQGIDQPAGTGTSQKVPFKKVFGLHMANIGMYLLQNAGVTANINILEFNKAQSNLAFNKSMEGGIGICLRLYDNIFISASNELYFSRQLRQNIKSYENQKLVIDGRTITDINQLDINNDNYYVTRNIIARSFKVIIIF